MTNENQSKLIPPDAQEKLQKLLSIMLGKKSEFVCIANSPKDAIIANNVAEFLGEKFDEENKRRQLDAKLDKEEAQDG
jgi:hypothetical protein